MQGTITVDDNVISGILHYLPAIASSGPLAYDGHFLALQFTKNDNRATDIKIGLSPSKDGMPLVSLDSDMDAVLYISNINQKLIVEEVSSINYQELDIDYNSELLELILKQNELTITSGKFNTKAFEGEKSKIDKRKLKKVLDELKKKKKSGNKLTTEEKKLIDGLTNKKKMLIAKILFFAIYLIL